MTNCPSHKDTECVMNVSGASFAKAGGTTEEPDILFGGDGVLNLKLDEVTQGRDIRVLLGRDSRARITGAASLATLEGLSPKKGDTIRVGKLRRYYNGNAWE